MRLDRKTVWKALGAAGALLCVLAAALVLVLQSDWFRDQMRRRIAAQVEVATGGKVEIAAFDYDWRKLTADLRGFVIHGSEPPAAAPLLSVEKARVTVKIISILKRSADVSSIVLTRPRVNLIVAADGSTNLPTPLKVRKNGKDPLQELFALKLKHFEIVNGLALVEEKRVPLNLRGDGVDVVVRYRRAGPSYEITAAARQVDLGIGGLRRGPLRFAAQATLQTDRITIHNARLNGNEANLFASGAVIGFAHPRADFQVDASALTNEVLPLIKVGNVRGVGSVRGGKLALRGRAHYDDGQGWSFQGKAEAQQAGYYSRALTLPSVNAGADVDANRSGLVLRHLTAATRGAKLAGEATLKNYRNLSLEGNLSDLTLREVGSFFTDKPLAWQGVAGGRVYVTATLDSKANDFAAEATMLISPLPAGIPVSGVVEAGYRQKSNSIEFGDSRLNFPHSTIAFSGNPRKQTQVSLDSSNLEDLKPAAALIGLNIPRDAWPVLLRNGAAHFDGAIGNLLGSVKFDGQLKASQVRVLGEAIGQLNARFAVSANGLEIASGELRQGDTKVSAAGLLGFDDWAVKPDSPLRAAITLRSVNITQLAAHFPQIELPIIQGIASGSVELRGTIGHPEGRAHIASDSLDAYGERLNQIQFDATLRGDELSLAKGRVDAGAAVLAFSGDYSHSASSWTSGQAHVKLDSNGFPLASLTPVRKYEPALNAQAEIHFEATARVSPGKLEPVGADGTILLRNITFNQIPYGDVSLRSATRGGNLEAQISGDFRKNPLHGTALVALAGENKTSVEIDFDRVTLQSIYSLTGAESPPLLDGFMTAKLFLEGPLQKPDQMRATLRSDQLQLSSHINADPLGKSTGPEISLHNAGPLVVEASKGVATVRSFHVEGDNTSLGVSGTVPFQGGKAMDLHVAGSVNLQAYHLFDPNVQSAGISTISVAIGGTFRDPKVNGTLELKDGSFYTENIPNGLSAVNGAVTFNNNRATLQKMTADSGGGQLMLGGFLSFGGGAPLVYHLEGSAENVRVRYAGSISVTASAKLRLTGSSTSALLSGTLTVARVVFNTNTDVGNILAGLGSSSGAPNSENEFLTGLHMDVMIESAPNLQLSASLSRDVEADIDLRLRGTPEHPILLGSLSANQGDIQAFGTRFTINRGEISFRNPVKIEPVLDLDLETRARGVTVDITISGIFSKLNIAYRSDPPLQPREIIALLAVGRAPASTDAVQSLRTNDVNNLQSGANSLLGAAATSPVTNRLSKLFGISNIRIDPLVQGITNTPQTRVTLEQQISPDVTVTYITNLTQTSEQIFRLEWAFSRQFSVVALRDDNGEFGIDFQYKKQFK
jgi:translocation and assembly module TamB